uniref:Rho guanine nucleotide exchange factor 12 n=1 Tax=Molossus molossus TaxID=27622 RepID=A0A7J8ENF2_MOLMO|nr:Rho guanine nucleotide exchange factor 12 [Molossus molossus]
MSAVGWLQHFRTPAGGATRLGRAHVQWLLQCLLSHDVNQSPCSHTSLPKFPLKKPIRHGSILNRESPTDKKQKVERSTSHDFDPTGLVQRCVVIQKDDNGFGLTVSGDNPVFVQSVKEDGAAMRAGVQTGDRIIKVNGTLVTHSNHLEVVQLIKCR